MIAASALRAARAQARRAAPVARPHADAPPPRVAAQVPCLRARTAFYALDRGALGPRGTRAPSVRRAVAQPRVAREAARPLASSVARLPDLAPRRASRWSGPSDSRRPRVARQTTDWGPQPRPGTQVPFADARAASVRAASRVSLRP